MDPPSVVKKALIIVTFLIYCIQLYVNTLSGRGGSKLFPYSVGEVSREYPIEITPVGATFAIWGAIFIYQLTWLVYALTTICRSSVPSANILSSRFYIFFNLNILLVIAWLYAWCNKKIFTAFLVLVGGQICVDIAIFVAVVDLQKFINDQQIMAPIKCDLWSQRLLVQNGILFYATWTTIATLINLAVTLHYKYGVKSCTASVISLSILGGLAILWFILENFIAKLYTKYTFTAYITLMIGTAGVFAANKKPSGNKVVRYVSCGLFILSAVFLVLRIIIICIRSKIRSNKRASVDVEIR